MVHAIDFQDVAKAFRGSALNAVDHVSFTVAEGEFVTILGSSGCGKTTLLKMVNRLYEPDSGMPIKRMVGRFYAELLTFHGCRA